jgi:hypothetical protein
VTGTNNHFEEKQYLGRNLHMLGVRSVLVIFCFVAYFWSKNKELSGNLFLVVGIAIASISLLLVFMTHFRTRVFDSAIELDQYWSIRKVKIPFKNLKSVEVVPYSRFKINNPVFNLHLKGRIHFYTTGDDAVQLEDKDGLLYLIGSKEPQALAEAIQSRLNAGV